MSDRGEPPLMLLPDAEVDLVLAAIRQEYGYDFRHYQRVFVRRRLRAVLRDTGIADLPELAAAIHQQPGLHEAVMNAICISVTEMFRDPTVFLALRRLVVPVLQTYPFVRVWVAGCATGEEAFSLAVLLHEAGMAGRFQIYATDIFEPGLQRARDGLLPVAAMKTNTRNYLLAGGTSDFSGYYTASHGMTLLNAQLRQPILFSRHDLAGSARFNEFQLILCRNVLIYFDTDLRARVHELLYDSLVSFGFLVVGQKESLRFSVRAGDYGTVDRQHRIYRRTH